MNSHIALVKTLSQNKYVKLVCFGHIITDLALALEKKLVEQLLWFCYLSVWAPQG